MGFFDFLKPADPLEKSAKQWARMLIKWQRDNPGRPVSDCVSTVRPLMQRLYQEGTGQKTLDELFAGKRSFDMRELCVAFVQLQHPSADRASIDRAVDRALLSERA